jgi:alkaline phosphatase
MHNILAKRILFTAFCLVWLGRLPLQAEQKKSPYAPERYPLLPDRAVDNVILFIGDGMGINHFVLSRLHHQGRNGWYHMERMPIAGYLRTDSADLLFTDSAAAATAIATGFKTIRGMCAALPDSTRTRGILLSVKERGMKAGLVAMTDGVVGATAACFSTSVSHRDHFAEIARQQVESGVDIMIGPGREWFIPSSEPGSKRTDELNLLERARQKGYDVINDMAALERTHNDHILAFLSERSVHSENIVPITKKTLDLLDRGKHGFFLMVETDETDIAGHERDNTHLIDPVHAFDKAVGAAIAFALQDRHTLVIVLADHETGGLCLAPDDSLHAGLVPTWASSGHTAQPAPLFAFGPHAVRFSGMLDNTEPAYILAELLTLSSFPSVMNEKAK